MIVGMIEKEGQTETLPEGKDHIELLPCEFKLRTAKGIAIYQRLARQLSETGRLTAEMHLRLSRYALAADTIHDCQARSKSLRASMVDQLRRAEKDLGLEEALRPSAPPEPVKPNKFAHCGFASRPRRTP